MIAKWVLAASITPLLLSMGSAQQRGSTPSISPSGRFQLVSGQVEYQTVSGNGVAAHEVFLLDSQSGRVWRFQPNSEIETAPGKHQFVEEKFVSVAIEQ